MITPEFKGFLHSIVETLDQLGLLYAIGGSVASSIYGEARSTLDVDISAGEVWDALVAAYRSTQP